MLSRRSYRGDIRPVISMKRKREKIIIIYDKIKAALWPPLKSLGLYETYVILAVDVFLIPFSKA